jgi:primosomal protein N' (replication factor Y)
LVNIIVSGVDEAATQETAQKAADWINGLLRERRLTDPEVIGPAPSPIERIRDRWRWHLLLRGTSPRMLGRVTRYFAERFRLPAGKADLRLAIDRDPVALL